MRVRELAVWTLVLSIGACSSGLHAPAGPGEMGSPNDWPRLLAGAWNIELRLDSVMSREGGTPRWRAASFRTATGRLELFDSTAGQPTMLRSRIDIALDSLLGRPMSCFDPRPTVTGVEREDDTIRLRFTPNAYDCGFGAVGQLRGDSLVGTWDETSFAGPVAMGRFRMVRATR